MIPGLAHVHGLGVSPGDDTLYAATHFGLWRIPSKGEPRRVGKYAHDLMGFSVIGADHFIASGHPNSARDLPPHLGLIESTDAGQTWESVSRMGESDFHILRSGDRRTYGWSSTSGTLAVTTDHTTWTERDGIDLVDLVIDPKDDQSILATVAVSDTELALRSSDDGGRNWNELEAPVGFVRLNWPEDGAPWGVAEDGRVFSRDGDDWSEQGRLDGTPEAITSDATSWFAAAGGAIHRSRDDGRTWDVVVEYDA